MSDIVLLSLCCSVCREAKHYCDATTGGDPPTAQQDPQPLHIVHVTAEMAPIAKVSSTVSPCFLLMSVHSRHQFLHRIAARLL